MKKQALRSIVSLSLFITLAVAPADAQTAAGAKRKTGKCFPVGGSLMTNFISENTTLGTVTGDLRGAVSAVVAEILPGENGKLIGKVQHRWVTEAGDIFQLGLGTVELVPVSPGVYHATYEPTPVVGGTGKFEHATGQIINVGSVDFNRGETVFRYHGEICAGK